MHDFEFAPRTAFAGMTPAADGSGGVFVTDRDGLGFATVLARKGETAPLAARVRQLFDVELPSGPRRTAGRDVAFAGTGPGAWLASSEHACNAFATALREHIGDLASVSDQSDGYAALRLSGPKVRETLAKLVSIDLHPGAFQPGRVASTLAAHIPIHLWRLEDNADGSPVFELTVFRSLAHSLWHALATSAAEFGGLARPPMVAPIRVDALPLIPWKNGRGCTRQVSVGPEGADIETFAWRVTIADIECGPVPFSHFAGIDRTTAVTGSGLRLARLAAGTAMLPVEPFQPFAVSGEEELEAELQGARLQAFNLMVRRGRARGTMNVHRGSAAISLNADLFVCFCVNGRAVLEIAGEPPIALEAGETLKAAPNPAASCQLNCETEETIVLTATVQKEK